jgi:N-carbamoyl-L-amino-acid hydrolase
MRDDPHESPPRRARGGRERSARLSPAIQTAIREAAQSANLSPTDLPSGAVHDAGEISRIAPMGMIFVPSRGGISHAPKEFTSAEDCANGVEVLYRTILLLDRRLQPK